MPGCAGVSALAADDGRELQGEREAVIKVLGNLVQKGGVQAHGHAVWSNQSPQAGKSCLVQLPLESVLVYAHKGNTPSLLMLTWLKARCQHSNG